jgi:hypothetical protein
MPALPMLSAVSMDVFSLHGVHLFYKIVPTDRDAGMNSHPSELLFFLFCVVLQSGIFTRVLQLRAARKRRQLARRLSGGLSFEGRPARRLCGGPAQKWVTILQ